jgi:hypothetical protein
MTDEKWLEGDIEMTGFTMGLAIVIEATDAGLGIDLQNACLTMRFGQRGVEWHKVGQFLTWRDGKAYDRIEVIAKGELQHVYFDISSLLRKYSND